MPVPAQHHLRSHDFREIATPIPLRSAIQEAKTLVDSGKSRYLVIAGRSRSVATESHWKELVELMEEHKSVGSEVTKTVGEVASAFIVAGCGAGVVVVQAASAA